MTKRVVKEIVQKSKKVRKVKQTEDEKRNKYLLKTYGISSEEYTSKLATQGGKCAVCGRSPGKTRLAVDHLHIKGFKKMSPEEKRKYVRGLCCFVCNRYFIGRVERCYKAPRPALEGLVKYFNQYPLKGEL